MNIRDYIESGVLEAYIAGELNEKEMLKVEDMAQKHPEIQKELEDLHSSLNAYAKATGNQVDESVLKEVLSEIDLNEKEKFLSIMNEGTENEIQKVNIIPVWSIAATILLVISLGFNYIFYNQFKETKDRLTQIESNNTLLAEQVNDQQQNLQYAELRIAHFLNEDNIHVRMDGLEVAPESFANVFWNKQSNAVFISVDNLPEPPSGHQYQLWAIKPGQAPIDAGIFDHTQLVQELKVIKGNVQAFAVTLEKEGGSPIATVDQTYVKGFLEKS